MSNPFNIKGSDLNKIGRRYAFDIAIVESVEATANHTIMCHLRTEPRAKFVAPMLVPASGDINMPNVGDLVVVGYSKAGQAFVLGVVYGREDNVPTHKVGERRIGHERTDSHVTIKRNGDIHVKTDGKVVINDGTDNPVVDVTTTSADGYLTSITLIKQENVFL